MPPSSEPLVSVVTPVYNGGKYLAQCIESVLSQTYSNWEYIIVNNCSTDDSLEIAKRFAAEEPRIRVFDNREHLKWVASWNYSVGRISAGSQYCKVVHADDWLFSECLSRMVGLAEANPSSALVSCYVLLEKSFRSGSVERSVLNAQVSPVNPVVPGREMARACLLGDLRVTFTPSSLLVRSASIRQRDRLYDETTGISSAMDTQVGLDLLGEGDFAFAPQVLVCAREHGDSLTSTSYRHWVDFSERLRLLRHFGPRYLTRDEFTACWKREMSAYSRFLGRSMFAFRGREFWKFHRDQLRDLGCPMGFFSLSIHAVREVFRLLWKPFAYVEQRWQATRSGRTVSQGSV
jgi:glycosyltransferase involved in cell wall biosynthesis